MEKLKNKKLFLLDMDGTIYLDNNLFDGTLEFLDYVRDIGGRAMFLTNNSSKSVNAYVEKLESMGIKATADDFFTSTDATIIHLKGKGYKKIYALGTKSFVNQLKAEGLYIVTTLEDGIDCLCISNDTELTFKKLEDACILLGGEIDYVATNPDWVCPTSYGYVPDCGSFADMLYRATKRRPKFIGKPEPDMAKFAMEKAGFSREETILVGDRLYTDIACGVNAGISTVFVLSGEGKIEDITEESAKPQYIFENIKKFHETLMPKQ